MASRSGPLSIAVVCEARADFQVAARLVDRLLLARRDWLSDVEHARSFWQAPSGDPFLRWDKVPTLARERRLNPAGHFDGQPGAMDAANARRALLLLATDPRPPSLVILVRDTDGHTERCRGLQQARTDPKRRWPFAILLGAAHPMRESWVVAGFQPQDERERERLATVTAELGFDPRLSPEKLDATDEQAKRSAKRVLRQLTNEDREREQPCLAATPLDDLMSRGQGCGLANFLLYVERRVLPLV